MLSDTLKNIGSFIRELLTGIIHPGNHLLFAKSLFFWVIIISIVSLSVLLITRITPVQPDTPVAETPKGDLSLPDTILAEVGEQKIYKSDIKKLARAQYVDEAIDDEVLRRYLDLKIEKVLLDQEAVSLKIQISDEQIAMSTALYESTQSATTANLHDYVYYQLLKAEIMKKQTKSVTAFVIGFWIPPLNYPQEAVYDKQRRDGRYALSEAVTKLKQDETPFTVAKNIYDKYPSLRPILGFNFLNFEAIKDKRLQEAPKLFVLDPEKLKKLNDPEFYGKLSSMQENEVDLVERTDNSGGAAIKMVSINDKGFISYDEFLIARTNEKVTKYLK